MSVALGRVDARILYFEKNQMISDSELRMKVADSSSVPPPINCNTANFFQKNIVGKNGEYL